MGVKLAAASGGSIELVPTNTASNFTVTVPASTGTMLTTSTAGSVLQVVQTASTVEVSTTSTATVITASITPSSASNKIMTLFTGEVTNTASSNSYGYLSLARSGSSLGGLKSVGMQVAAYLTVGTAGNFLDSPATTSSITYTLTIGKGSGGTVSASCSVGATIILMEIAA